jgi:hypothetical protein
MQRNDNSISIIYKAAVLTRQQVVPMTVTSSCRPSTQLGPPDPSLSKRP